MVKLKALTGTIQIYYDENHELCTATIQSNQDVIKNDYVTVTTARYCLPSLEALNSNKKIKYEFNYVGKYGKKQILIF